MSMRVPIVDQRSYEQVHKALSINQRGSYGDLSYMPVFRASALCYAICGIDVNTRVGFLNYWREKNGINGIGVLVTVRDAQGVSRVRQYVQLNDMTGHFDLHEMLGSNLDFTGSMEVEFFSAEDLKFQFPGITVFYQTPGGVSYVHSNQRVYNDGQDKARGSGLNAWQTGFDVCVNQGAFAFIVNGPTRFAGGGVGLQVVSSSGSSRHQTIDMPALEPYATYCWRPESVEGVIAFLGLEPGMCKLDVPLVDVHLRLAVGHDVVPKSSGVSMLDGVPERWLSVTHSFFDATHHADYFDTGQLAPDVCPAFIPFVLPERLNLEVVLYPIYSFSEMRLSLFGFDKQGTEILKVSLKDYQTPEAGIRRMNIRELLAENSKSVVCSLFVLRFDPIEKQRLPSRITYGLNFYTENRIGTNISSSAYIAPSWGLGARSWKWGAIALLEGASNLINICAFRNSDESFPTNAAECTLKIYDRQGLVTQFIYNITNCTSQTLRVEALLEEAAYAYQPNAILWYVVESTQPWLDVVGLTVSAQGNVGGDHSF